MKKKHTLIIGAQFLALAFVLLYGYLQKMEAQRAGEMIYHIHLEAEKQRMLAIDNEHRAHQFEAELKEARVTIEELRSQLKK
jgi:hypothetical protein